MRRTGIAEPQATDMSVGLSRLTADVGAGGARLVRQTARLVELVDDTADEVQLLALSLALARKRIAGGDERLERMAERVQQLVTATGTVVRCANRIMERLHKAATPQTAGFGEEIPEELAEPLTELAERSREISRLMIDTLDVVSWVPSGLSTDAEAGGTRVGFTPSDVERRLYRSAVALADLATDLQSQLVAITAE